MCIWSHLGKNPKYKSNKKNEGRIPPLNDYRVAFTPWSCGKCIECRKKLARDWTVRLMEDIKTNKNGRMITLTLSNESYAKLDAEIHETIKGYHRDNAIATLAIRKFTERWRKKYRQKTVRHWLVTELGHKGTENIHLHGIIWVDKIIKRIKIKGQRCKDTYINYKPNRIQQINEIKEIWEYGWIWPRYDKDKLENYVNEKTVNYNVKYIHKIDKDHKHYQSIILTSNGIGANYLNSHNAKTNKYKKGETDETYTTKTGKKIALPTYYRNKLYTDEEKEKLWIEKLDKETRWVLGREIDISKGETQYKKALEEARIRNHKLGYGNGKTNIKEKENEEARRIIMQQTRIKKGTKIIHASGGVLTQDIGLENGRTDNNSTPAESAGAILNNYKKRFGNTNTM